MKDKTLCWNKQYILSLIQFVQHWPHLLKQTYFPLDRQKKNMIKLKWKRKKKEKCYVVIHSILACEWNVKKKEIKQNKTKKNIHLILESSEPELWILCPFHATYNQPVISSSRHYIHTTQTKTTWCCRHTTAAVAVQQYGWIHISCNNKVEWIFWHK